MHVHVLAFVSAYATPIHATRMHASACVCVCTLHICVDTCVCTRACVHVGARACTQMHVLVRACVCVFVSLRVCERECERAYAGGRGSSRGKGGAFLVGFSNHAIGVSPSASCQQLCVVVVFDVILE